MTYEELVQWTDEHERRMGLYTIMDRVAEDCGPVFFARKPGVAIRQFSRMVSHEGLDPDDFILIAVGGFDSQKCELVKLEVGQIIHKPEAEK